MNDYILMLEDDGDDRYFTKTTLLELGLDAPVKYEVFSSDLLQQIAVDNPLLIILGHNLYPESCVEILKKIKSSSSLVHIPVIILIENVSAVDIRKYYALGANSVIKKPFTVDATRAKIQTFFNYWLHVAEL